MHVYIRNLLLEPFCIIFVSISELFIFIIYYIQKRYIFLSLNKIKYEDF